MSSTSSIVFTTNSTKAKTSASSTSHCQSFSQGKQLSSKSGSLLTPEGLRRSSGIQAPAKERSSIDVLRKKTVTDNTAIRKKSEVSGLSVDRLSSTCDLAPDEHGDLAEHVLSSRSGRNITSSTSQICCCSDGMYTASRSQNLTFGSNPSLNNQSCPGAPSDLVLWLIYGKMEQLSLDVANCVKSVEQFKQYKERAFASLAKTASIILALHIIALNVVLAAQFLATTGDQSKVGANEQKEAEKATVKEDEPAGDELQQEVEFCEERSGEALQTQIGQKYPRSHEGSCGSCVFASGQEDRKNSNAIETNLRLDVASQTNHPDLDLDQRSACALAGDGLCSSIMATSASVYQQQHVHDQSLTSLEHKFGAGLGESDFLPKEHKDESTERSFNRAMEGNDELSNVNDYCSVRQDFSDFHARGADNDGSEGLHDPPVSSFAAASCTPAESGAQRQQRHNMLEPSQRHRPPNAYLFGQNRQYEAVSDDEQQEYDHFRSFQQAPHRQREQRASAAALPNQRYSFPEKPPSLHSKWSASRFASDTIDTANTKYFPSDSDYRIMKGVAIFTAEPNDITLEAFLTDFEEKAAVACMSEAGKLFFLTDKLGQKPKGTVLCLPQSEHKSWLAVVRALEHCYSSAETPQHWQAKFRKRHRDGEGRRETIREWSTAIFEMYSKGNPSWVPGKGQDGPLVEKFLEGIPKDLRREVVRAKCQSFDECVTTAVEVESAEEFLRSFDGGPQASPRNVRCDEVRADGDCLDFGRFSKSDSTDFQQSCDDERCANENKQDHSSSSLSCDSSPQINRSSTNLPVTAKYRRQRRRKRYCDWCGCTTDHRLSRCFAHRKAGAPLRAKSGMASTCSIIPVEDCSTNAACSMQGEATNIQGVIVDDGGANKGAKNQRRTQSVLRPKQDTLMRSSSNAVAHAGGAERSTAAAARYGQEQGTKAVCGVPDDHYWRGGRNNHRSDIGMMNNEG